MKKKVICGISLLLLAFTLQGFKQDSEPITKEDGMYIVNTTTLCNKTGYAGTTPLKIYIQKNKVVKIQALRNQETPKYFTLVKKELLTKWDGMKVNDAVKKKVDGVTGATLSSNALIENVKSGLQYYQKHK